MEKKRKSTIISVLAVTFCFLLISLAWAQLTGSDKAWIKRKLPNTLRRVSLPIWGITQDGTGLSLKWQDNALNPRFAIYDPSTPGNNSDDMVLDKETGLIWARDANLDGTKTWQVAINYCRNNVTLGNRRGWRLPTVEELSSLVDPSQFDPTLPTGHPFINVQFVEHENYWSSTTYESNSVSAMTVTMYPGWVIITDKSLSFFVWPVRGGNAYATGNW